MTIVAITGGRRDAQGSVLYPSIHQLRSFWKLAYTELGMVRLIHGAALGTDRTVAAYVQNQNKGWNTVAITPPIPHYSLERLPVPNQRLIYVDAYPVDIRVDGPWPLAGHKRNERMLTHSKAEVLIAFPGGTGTRSCTLWALGMGLRVWRWEGDREQGEFKEITAP